MPWIKSLNDLALGNSYMRQIQRAFEIKFYRNTQLVSGSQIIVLFVYPFIQFVDWAFIGNIMYRVFASVRLTNLHQLTGTCKGWKNVVAAFFIIIIGIYISDWFDSTRN